MHLFSVVTILHHLKFASVFPLEIQPVQNAPDLRKIMKAGERIPLQKKTIEDIFRLKKEVQPEKKGKVETRLHQIPRRKGRYFFDRLFAEPVVLNPGYDFFQFYKSGIDFREGLGIYENYGEDEIERAAELQSLTPFHHPNRYLPVFAVPTGIVFSLLTPWNAYFWWLVMLEALLLSFAWYLYRMSERASVTPAALSMLFGFVPFYLELYLGQTSFIVGLCLVFIIVGMEKNRSILTGIAFFIGTAIKLIPLYLGFYFLRKRRWFTLILPVSAVVVLSGLYFLDRPEDFDVFWSWMLGEEKVPSVNFRGLMDYFFPEWSIAVILALILAGAALRTFGKEPLRPHAAVLLWISVYFLTYNHVWQHHYNLFIPLFAYLLIKTGDHRLWIPFIATAFPSHVLGGAGGGRALSLILVRTPKIAGVLWMYFYAMRKNDGYENQN